ncbi:MAG: hypothetical protein C7B45_00640 [Sulfobacillus acidophilus]|uniref:Uncharacterized protein n=1 Tax=Sulfobacillus acidophilus TaxID=53633 RepID=A0A2T2WPJ0_9FIRM|nr:MAG: hypothetical protein C7B45_00640 [Sulfobacillus acidophilus]
MADGALGDGRKGQPARSHPLRLQTDVIDFRVAVWGITVGTLPPGFFPLAAIPAPRTCRVPCWHSTPAISGFFILIGITASMLGTEIGHQGPPCFKYADRTILSIRAAIGISVFCEHANNIDRG